MEVLKPQNLVGFRPPEQTKLFTPPPCLSYKHRPGPVRPLRLFIPRARREMDADSQTKQNSNYEP